MESVTRGIPAPRPPGALTENELIDRWDRSLPLASVLVLTYNHEHFFDDCMSGILGQRSRFPFEVIIRDDASTDATSRKALSYAMNWPRIVRVLQEEYRTWPDVTPMPTLIQESRGEMIFLCEGDDYWTDDNYLQTGMEKITCKPAWRSCLKTGRSPCTKPHVCTFAMGWSLERLVRVMEKLDAWRSGGHALTLTN